MTETIVIKIGGNAMTELTPAFYQQIKLWRTAGKKILLVHGGGNKISEYCQKLQLPVIKKDGIRVTDPATLEVTQMVLLGLIQPQILQQLTKYHIAALGLNTASDTMIGGEALNPAELGAVGKITEIKTALFDTLLTDYVGVVAPLALDKKGEWLNVNGDNAAAELAVLLDAQALYLLTDVPGVLHNGQLVSCLTASSASALKAQGIITAGMQPKIQAAFYAFEHGIKNVQICQSLTQPGTILAQE